MNIYLFFIKNFLKGKNKHFLNFENILSALGIFIGVFAIIIVSSVMNGFDKDITKRILASKPEIIVHKKDYSAIKNYHSLIKDIKKIKKVKSAIPVCETELILINKKQFSPVRCIGISSEDITAINISKNIIIGSLQNFDENGIIISMNLSLDLRTTVGETITVSDIKGKIPTPFGLLPKKSKLKVMAIYKKELPNFNDNTVYANFSFLQKFSQLKGASYIQIETFNSTFKVHNELSRNLNGKYVTEDWTQLNSNIFKAIKLEKFVMMFVLTLMIVIAAFNMSGFLIKFIENKKNEIGILKTIGVNEKVLLKIFKFYSLAQGAIGSFFGFLFAFLLLIFQNKYHFIKIPVPGLPLKYLPVTINWYELVIIPFGALLICYFSIIYPIKKIKRVNIIDILRKTA